MLPINEFELLKGYPPLKDLSLFANVPSPGSFLVSGQH